MARVRHRYPTPSSPEVHAPERRRSDAVRAATLGRQGHAVDFMGGPVIDPTANVLALVEAANRRQDDLREMNNARIDAELRHEEQIGELRARHQEFVDLLRARHQEAIDALESKRLDAVRNVDQLAAKTEADRAASAVTALATAGTTTAVTLRSTVDTSAQALATQFANTVTTLTERIAALEKSSYTGQGKQAVVDPQVTEMLVEMRAIRDVAGGRRRPKSGHERQSAAPDVALGDRAGPQRLVHVHAEEHRGPASDLCAGPGGCRSCRRRRRARCPEIPDVTRAHVRRHLLEDEGSASGRLRRDGGRKTTIGIGRNLSDVGICGGSV